MFQVCVVSCFASVCQDAWHYAEEAVAFAEGAIAAGSAGRFEGICHLLWMLGLFPLLFRSPLSWHIVYFPRFRAFLGLVFFSSALGALLAPNNLGTRFYSEPGRSWIRAAPLACLPTFVLTCLYPVCYGCSRAWVVKISCGCFSETSFAFGHLSADLQCLFDFVAVGCCQVP